MENKEMLSQDHDRHHPPSDSQYLPSSTVRNPQTPLSYNTQIPPPTYNPQIPPSYNPHVPPPSCNSQPHSSSSYQPQAVHTLFINKLPTSINEAGIRNLFTEYGEIKNIYLHRSSDRAKSTNWGKVCFAKQQQAIEAISEVNGKPPLHLLVEFARDVEDKQGPREKIEMFWEKQEVSRILNNWGSIVRNHGWQDEVVDKVGQDWKEKTIEAVDMKKERPIEVAYTKKENEIDENHKNDEASPIPNQDSEASTADAASPSSSFTFGNPLLVPYMAPLSCYHCSNSGRIVCSRCHAWYCSQACQVNNWPKHRDMCRQVQNE